MDYTVNGKTLSYHPAGETRRGDRTVLLKKANDLTAKKPWSKNGFTIEKLFPQEHYHQFELCATSILIDAWKKTGLKFESDLNLSKYHTLINSFDQHLSALNETKLLRAIDFPGGLSRIEKRVSEICGVDLVAKNPFDQQSIFHFRVIRPESADNNPLHRDVWLEDYADCINIYIPVAGSNHDSSLILIPGSHHWPESAIDKTISGAMIDGIKFNVPAVTAIHEEYTVVRPDPQPNEVLVFSPYLIHGGAVNLNKDQTRISIEMRFWKR